VTVDAKLSVSSETTEVQVVGEGGVAVNTQSQELSQVVDTLQLSHLPSLTRNPYDFVALSGNVSAGDNTTNSMATAVRMSLPGCRRLHQRAAGSGHGDFVGRRRECSRLQRGRGQSDSHRFSAGIQRHYQQLLGGVRACVGWSGQSNHQVGHQSDPRFRLGIQSSFGLHCQHLRKRRRKSRLRVSVVDPKGAYTRNVFGFAAGGPIMKNKLFLFESTEWTRVRSSASETQEILDPSFISLLPANAQAYFKQYGTGAAAASGTVVTAGQLANAGIYRWPDQRHHAGFPVEQPVFDVVNFKVPFDAGGDVPQNTYSLVGRVDFNLSDKTTMYFRAARQYQMSSTAPTLTAPTRNMTPAPLNMNSSYLFSLNHVFSPSLLNSAKISYTRFNNGTSFDTALVNTPNLMIVPPSDPVTGGNIQMPGLQNSGSPGTGGLPFGGPQNTIQPQDDLSWTKGRHAMRFGGQFTYIQLNVAYGAYAQAVEQLGATIQDSFADLTNTSGNPNGSQLIAFQPGSIRKASCLAPSISMAI
jgi:hypothetical protein